MKHLSLIAAAMLCTGAGAYLIHRSAGADTYLGAAFLFGAFVCLAPNRVHLAREELAAAWAAFKNPNAAQDDDGAHRGKP